jgi:tetratricopeptide (TPR) repeat protein
MQKMRMRITVISLFASLLLCGVHGFAQQDLAQLRQTAQTFTRQGDYANALLVLNRADQVEPGNSAVQTDIAYVKYLQRDFSAAKETIGPLLDKADAEVRTFQVAGNIFKGMEEVKECEKAYAKGLKKFPQSGVLHSELGELYWAMKKPEDAIRTWEKGIKADAAHSGNYFHAAKYYYAMADKVWSIVYGETFLNLESYSTRTAEMKTILLESYKKFFTQSEVFKQYNAKKKLPFEEAFLETLNAQSGAAAQGITVGSLTAIRTRFILDWFEKYATRFPHRMIDQQQYFVREGLYEAYNQWLFGAASNAMEHQHWTQTHPTEQQAFNQYQRNRVFRMPAGQYYGTAD